MGYNTETTLCARMAAWNIKAKGILFLNEYPKKVLATML